MIRIIKKTMIELGYLAVMTVLLAMATVTVCAEYELNEGIGALMLLFGFGCIMTFLHPVCKSIAPGCFK